VDRKFGNGFCLPAGPLRETVSRLGSVDMVVHHGIRGGEYRFSLEFEDSVNLVTGEHKPLDSFSEITVHAVAGIGYPQRFFNQLRSYGLNVIEHPFPDHHAFGINDIIFTDGLPILMTEKDAVKCARLQPLQSHDSVLSHCWSVPVSAHLSSRLGPDLIELIRQCQ
jgi:tetraacyldisaccharide 4'-kinase